MKEWSRRCRTVSFIHSSTQASRKSNVKSNTAMTTATGGLQFGAMEYKKGDLFKEF
jgi:hypothetical protein